MILLDMCTDFSKKCTICLSNTLIWLQIRLFLVDIREFLLFLGKFSILCVDIQLILVRSSIKHLHLTIFRLTSVQISVFSRVDFIFCWPIDKHFLSRFIFKTWVLRSTDRRFFLHIKPILMYKRTHSLHEIRKTTSQRKTCSKSYL